MALNFKNLAPGCESFMPTFEDEDSSVSIEQKIEVETAAAEDAEEVEEVSEEVASSDEEADTAEEAAELYAKLEYIMEVNATYGLSQPVMAALNYNGELTAIVPNLPALESLSMVASPNDSASIIAQEGFTEAMKNFWEWIKKIARKIRDTIVNLASRVAGLFTRLDSTAKRLAKAIAEADINIKKLGDRKAKLMTKLAWNNLVGVLIGTDADMKKLVVAASKTLSGGDIKEALHIAGTIMSKFGIKIENGVVSNTDAAKDLFKTSEDSVSGHGWGKADCSNTQQVAKLYGMGRGVPEIAKKVKDIASTLESTASRIEKMTEGGDASGQKKARDQARDTVKILTQVQKTINLISKGCFQLVREFIKAQRAVYACRGNYDANSDKK